MNRGPSNAAAAVFTSQPREGEPDPLVGAGRSPTGGSPRSCSTPAARTASPGPRGSRSRIAPPRPRPARSASPRATCSSARRASSATSSTARSWRRACCRPSTGSPPTAGADAARAIMTTDTRPKTVVVERDGWRIGGMAKGAGMLAPGLATMLVVLTTDADVASDVLDAALRAATRVTFDRLDSDGCMSTNDQVTLMASGASGIVPDARRLRRRRDRGLRGRSPCSCRRTPRARATTSRSRCAARSREDDAVEVGRSVARNNLFKAAIFGNDPNWGRVLAAIGTTSAPFDPYLVDVSMNGVRVCHAGRPDAPARAGRPHAARDARAHRAARRRGIRHHPHQRPHARLRAREQRLRELTDDRRERERERRTTRMPPRSTRPPRTPRRRCSSTRCPG